ncbi:MAG: ABC transporter ATP-binding protein [Epibacterium sp.]|jgi:putative ABC transport system ATP-binding protein|nr:ABC transporter ATP-binding protein [Epibacterium sp.]NQX72546.1 ABC transporter ATP-binding protein [Epibacterium sp.]
MLLAFKNVTKRFAKQARAVFTDVSFVMAKGETVALTGESGAGKSTLLHLAGALDRVDAGTVTVNGADLSALNDQRASQLRRTQVALVFQQFNLIPSLCVRQNIALHAQLGRRLDADWTDHLTQNLGLSPFLERYPEELSGGQQQRVAIARALAVRPQLLLADEPTGNLDEKASRDVMRLMLDLTRDAGSGLLLVTHSTQIAGQLDRHLHLASGRVTEHPPTLTK